MNKLGKFKENKFKDELGFTIETSYGESYFQNSLKFFKFQMKCSHPSSFWVTFDDKEERVCERCCMIIQQKVKGKIVDCDGSKRYLGTIFDSWLH